MALKFKFKSKDEVPAEHASLYVEREGAWWLDVEGAVEKAKLDEFRNSNVALLKERDELKQRLEGIDQAVVTEATKRGLRATAIPDVTARARNTFRLVNGVPQAFEADGQTARVGKDGVTPLTLAEWIDAQGAPFPSPQPSPSGAGSG